MPEARKRIRELLPGLLESLESDPGPPTLRGGPRRADQKIHLVLYPDGSRASGEGTDAPHPEAAPNHARSWSEEVTVSGTPVRVRILSREMSLPAGERVRLVSVHYTPAASRALPRPVENVRLTVQEARVAELLARRRTNREIARELGISPHTSRHHTENVLRKLNVHTRREVDARLSAMGQG